ESWFVLHRRTKECAQAAETVDGDIVMLSAHWERRRAALTQLQEQLQSVPAFISELDAITANIAHLEGDFEEMESRLVYLETLCCQCEQQTSKQNHINQLEILLKMTCLLFVVELNSEHAQKVAELEQATRQKLRERQKVYEEAFNQDMEQYLSNGYLQHRGKALSFTSATCRPVDETTSQKMTTALAKRLAINCRPVSIVEDSGLNYGWHVLTCLITVEGDSSFTDTQPVRHGESSPTGTAARCCKRCLINR
uniref:Dystrobrevin binding protein 1a n=1 Tax=Sander lucioperca TaxID=283035 RepID=A0A8C9YG52_SANLU